MVRLRHSSPGMGPRVKSALLLIPALFLGIAGCSSPPNALPTLPSPEADSCDIRQYADLIGQDATALERVLILGQVRVIRPNTMVTQDFRPERVNFYIAADETIMRLACG